MKRKLNRMINWLAEAQAAGFRVNPLATWHNVCPQTLRQFFRDTHGVPPKTALRGWRMQKAYDLLSQGRSAKATALELGYKQLSHFSSDFKKHFRFPPSAMKPLRHSRQSLQE
jgi:transcriptional regulator GlxA family with amidase domain